MYEILLIPTNDLLSKIIINDKSELTAEVSNISKIIVANPGKKKPGNINFNRKVTINKLKKRKKNNKNNVETDSIENLYDLEIISIASLKYPFNPYADFPAFLGCSLNNIT